VPARDPLAIVREYHEQTKHHFNRFARSLGYLDWATQPDPFRIFDGSPRVDLIDVLRAAEKPGNPSVGTWRDTTYDALFGPVPSSAPVGPGLAAVSIFLRFSLGLSAWKQAGPSRWALRVNPSSGNLHPTEGYVLCDPGVAGAAPGVYHYAPDAHALEERSRLDPDAWSAACAGLPDGSFLAAISSIHWREAWKYGERAFRYCQHDVGHAVAAMRMAAAMMGWSCAMVPGWSSPALAALLGTDRDADFEGAEREEPACLMAVVPGGAPEAARASALVARAAPVLADAAVRGTWSGRANSLSSDHVQWDWIDAAAEASRDDRSGSAGRAEPDPVGPARGGAASGRSLSRPISAAVLFLQRRSAVSMDGRTAMGPDGFVRLLRRLLPEAGPPFDAFPWTPRIHLALFVHRVEGLKPGLYALPRTAAGMGALREAFSQDFAWLRPPGVPDDLPLFLLDHADCGRIARQLSCGQDIAADGCFSLGMLAEFDAALGESGPAAYRRLFWEAGAVGQALYLEAEAAGLRGTGIGCFFDDGVHQLLGIADHSLQSLYHFTVGGPVEDTRLTTQPGYSWESR
jgi:SagB-type dehydrogenase family enzyme